MFELFKDLGKVRTATIIENNIAIILIGVNP